MMTTMLVLTLLTLFALFFVLKRLRPLSQKPTPAEINDANNNNLNHSSSIEGDSDEPALPLSSKNCYVTLAQHDDEQNESMHGKTTKRNSMTRHVWNNLASTLESQPRYGTSSTNVLCMSDEQNRPLESDVSKSTSHIS